MPLKLYTMDISPPARAVMMVCEIMNVPVETIEVNLLAKEQLSPDFLRKNPLHTVPTLEDNDLILQDSHAILIYLTEVYGKDDSWYPKDVKKRALVNQKLFFDTAVLFVRMRNITYSVAIEGSKIVQPKFAELIEEAYGFMEQFLSRTRYIAGNHMTIADISAIATMSSLVGLVLLDEKKYPKTAGWMKEIMDKPYCKKHNEKGAAALDKVIKDRLAA